MPGSTLVSRACGKLQELASEVQKAIEEYQAKGRHLDGAIMIMPRNHLEKDVEAMKLKTRERRPDFFDNARDLLLENSNQWFAFFHIS
jgi:hypothetical protein